MLKQRLLTALVLLPLVIWGILGLPNEYFALLLALIVVQGGWEWSRLMQLKSTLSRLLFCLLVITGLLVSAQVFDVTHSDWLTLPVLSLFWWLLALFLVVAYPRSVARWSPRWTQGVIGVLVLIPTWVAVVGLHGVSDNGPYLVLYLLSLIWVADSGAYFGGRSWGKHKLAPNVSPGKTWEGVASAFFATAIYALLATQVFSLSGNLQIRFVVLSLVTVAFSILGDLAESMFKRHAGVKDSGTLLPGHGGVLDRIDSITAAAPIFVIGLWLIGIESLGVIS